MLCNILGHKGSIALFENISRITLKEDEKSRVAVVLEEVEVVAWKGVDLVLKEDGLSRIALIWKKMTSWHGKRD